MAIYIFHSDWQVNSSLPTTHCSVPSYFSDSFNSLFRNKLLQWFRYPHRYWFILLVDHHYCFILLVDHHHCSRLALDTVYPLWIIISAQSYWPTQQDHSIPQYLEFPFEKFKFIGDLCCTNSLFRITTSVIPTSPTRCPLWINCHNTSKKCL